MALVPLPFVSAGSPIKRPVPSPQILWPSAMGFSDDGETDLAKFPSLGAIKARLGASRPVPLLAFTNAAQNAQDRILILDDYLFKPKARQAVQSRYDQILEWFPDGLVANDVRILTNAHGSKTEHELIKQKFAERAAAINDRSRNREGNVTIEISFTLNTDFPYVHDRFAIVDDELWHFGATVGGLHEQLSTATRGWDSGQHEALRFFNEAWQGDRRSLGRGRHG